MRSYCFLILVLFFATEDVIALESVSCPGEIVLLECDRQLSAHEWIINGEGFLVSNTVSNFITGPYNITVTDVVGPPFTITSTVTFTSSLELNSTMITCRDPGLGDIDTEALSFTVIVRDTTPMSLSFEQLSHSTGRISWSLLSGSEQCVTSYSVSIGGSSMTTTNMFLVISTANEGVDVNNFISYSVTSNPGNTISSPAMFRIVNNSPSPPTFVSANVSTGEMCLINNVLISWMAPNDSGDVTVPPLTGYRLSCMLEGNSTDFCSSASIGGSDTSHPATDISRAGRYNLTLKAVNSDGDSAPANLIENINAANISSVIVAETISVNFNFPQIISECNGQQLGVQVEACGNCDCSGYVFTDPITRNHTVGSDPLVISPLSPGTNFCYRSTLTVGGLTVAIDEGSFMTQLPVPPAQLHFGTAVLVTMSGSDPVYQCANSLHSFRGFYPSAVAVFDTSSGVYTVPPCSVSAYILIIIVLVFAFIIGVVGGVILSAFCLHGLISALTSRKIWAIILVAVLCLFGIGIGILIFLCCCRRLSCCQKGKGGNEEDGLANEPPPDSLYADPKAIEHTTAPDSEAQYAMVDMATKNKKKKKQTQPEALYQDPGKIEHETTDTGAEYAVVDKRASKKKKEPDVVPGPADGGLQYAAIDVSSKGRRAQGGSQRQAQEPVGSVEYSTISTEGQTL